MKLKVKSHCDVWSGILFMGVGLAFASGATEYAFGSSAKPGPGYFPLGLGLLLVLLGAGVVLQGIGMNASQRQDDATELIGPWAWKQLGIVVGSIALFGVTLPYLGMLLALPILVVTISTAVHGFRWVSVLVCAAILTVACYLIFVLGLNLTLPVLPAFLP